MATNDWTVFTDGSSESRFQWRKNKTLFIVQQQLNNKWSAFLYDDDAGNISAEKSFISKSKAIAYANNFMRSH